MDPCAIGFGAYLDAEYGIAAQFPEVIMNADFFDLEGRRPYLGQLLFHVFQCGPVFRCQGSFQTFQKTLGIAEVDFRLFHLLAGADSAIVRLGSVLQDFLYRGVAVDRVSIGKLLISHLYQSFRNFSAQLGLLSAVRLFCFGFELLNGLYFSQRSERQQK